MTNAYTIASADLAFARALEPELAAQDDAALIGIIDALLPHLAVAIRTYRPPAKRFLPAGRGRWSGMGRITDPLDMHNADRAVQQRRAMEKQRFLLRGNRRPVSGFLVLVGLPGREGLVTWLNGGRDDTTLYGDYLTLLKPKVLGRSILLAGDSMNLHVSGRFNEQTLTLAQAALLLAYRGHVGDARPIPGLEHAPEYLEALVLGGVDFDHDTAIASTYAGCLRNH